jgi:hypothetical protein
VNRTIFGMLCHVARLKCSREVICISGELIPTGFYGISIILQLDKLGTNLDKCNSSVLTFLI